MSKPTGLWRIFRIPLALAVVSGVGLVAALLSEGGLDVVWTAAVAVPVAVLAAVLLRRRKT